MKDKAGMTNCNSSYIVKVGEDGQYRLDILNGIFGPQSERFLKLAGINPGMRVLDVGCGQGNMSFAITKLVGKTGHVTGIDVSQDQINLAAKRASEQELSNVKFVMLAAENVRNLAQQFDFIYGRFILMHVKEPQKFWKIYISVWLKEAFLHLRNQR